MKNLSKLEVEALCAVQSAQRMVEFADKICAEAGMDGDEVMLPLDEARHLLEQVIKVIQG